MIDKISYKVVFNRGNRLKKDGSGLIQVELLLHGKRVYFSTHVYVYPDEFMNGKVVNHPLSDDYNYVIYEIKHSIERVEIDYLKRGISPTLEMMKTAVKENTSPSAKFIDFGKSVVENSERKERTKNGYDTLFNNIEIYRKGTLLSEMDYNFIVKYDLWLKNSGISHNTRVGRLRQIKAILNEAVKRNVIDKNPFDMFKIPQMTNKKGFLSLKDIMAMEKFICTDKRQENARDAFLFCCYTGLRYSDFMTLRSEHIKNGWITKRMEKTKFVVEIPIEELFDGKAVRLIEKYDGDITKLSGNIGTNATLNKALKPIFAKLKLDGSFTFHTSRHSFASNLLLIGLPITSVQKMLGHRKLSTTQIYGEVNRETIKNDLKKVLKKSKKNNERTGIKC